jgi:hypothetical protein
VIKKVRPKVFNVAAHQAVCILFKDNFKKYYNVADENDNGQ